LIDISHKRLPEGKFDTIWPEASLKPPPKPPAKANFGDQMAYRKYCDEVEKRKRHNNKIKAEVNAWFLKGNSEYFQLLVKTMTTTAPGLVSSTTTPLQRPGMRWGT